jgi:hypothetical protein
MQFIDSLQKVPLLGVGIGQAHSTYVRMWQHMNLSDAWNGSDDFL